MTVFYRFSLSALVATFSKFILLINYITLLCIVLHSIFIDTKPNVWVTALGIGEYTNENTRTVSVCNSGMAITLIQLISLMYTQTSCSCMAQSMDYNKLPQSSSGLALALFGVVQTPVKSKALPSMVFILRKMSALLQVDRAGDSGSELSGLRGSFLCKKTAISNFLDVHEFWKCSGSQLNAWG